MKRNASIAILSYRRPDVLNKFINSLHPHLTGSEDIAIFDDCSPEDIESAVTDLSWDFCRSDERLGVAGNSNRAIQRFMEGGNDYLYLCNDDLIATGDFVTAYQSISRDTGFQVLCLAPSGDIIQQDSRLLIYPSKIYGGMLMITRKAVERIGYFDPRFGYYGIEHVDYCNRAALAGLTPSSIGEGRGAAPLFPMLEYQDAPCSLGDAEKQACEYYANRALARLNYGQHGTYRPCIFKTEALQANRYLEAGILTSTIEGYARC
jgi:glycosyltransferase involved in cell wall biosynthesis